MRHIVSFAAVVVVAAGCGGSHRQAISSGAVTVGGSRLVVHCSGSGAPTVVMEAGMGFGSETWTAVQPGVARITHVCAYDRLGEGRSDRPPEVQTLDDEARTLAELAAAAGWDGPYVLVGHSWGGAVIERFAADRPDDVAGIVFVDSAQGRRTKVRWLSVVPPKPTNGRDPYPDLRGPPVKSDPHRNPEWVDTDAAETELDRLQQELSRLRTLDAIPLVVLSSDTFAPAFVLPTGPYDRAYAVWLDGHDRLARLSSNSAHAVTQFSGHMIQAEQPDVVLASIRAVVRAARDDAPLPQCRAVFRGFAGGKCR